MQKELGRRIARERRHHGITLRALSIESGVTVPALVRLEHGKGSTLHTVEKVLAALYLKLELVRDWEDWE